MAKLDFKTIFNVLLCLLWTSDLQLRSESAVQMTTVTDINFSKLASLDDMKAAAANPEMVKRLEEILSQWCKQIEQVCRLMFYFFTLVKSVLLPVNEQPLVIIS